MASPLDKWQRPGATPVTDSPKEKGSQAPYKAFSNTPASPRLWLKTGALGGGKALSYGYLTDVETDCWSIIGLTYALPFPGPVVIEIRGECMGPIAEAIINGSAAWIEVFNRERHIDPPEGVAIIREIIIHDKPSQPGDGTKH